MRALHSGRCNRREQLGAAAVEFAIMLPLMLAVIGGITDFGRAFLTQVTLTNAAREGARAAIGGSSAANAELRAGAAASGLQGFSATVVPCAGAGSDATTVARVTGFRWIVLDPVLGLFPGPGTPFPTTLESTAVMRCT